LAKQDVLQLDGVITDVLPGATFKVKLNDVDREILCHLSGKMRKFSIKCILGDRVELEMSPYDMDKGRITRRHK